MLVCVLPCHSIQHLLFKVNPSIINHFYGTFIIVLQLEFNKYIISFSLSVVNIFFLVS